MVSRLAAALSFIFIGLFFVASTSHHSVSALVALFSAVLFCIAGAYFESEDNNENDSEL